MRFFEFKQIVKEMEARIQHAEDIIFWEGSAGAKRALQSLANMATGGHKDVTIKWDGSPAVIFGRDAEGKFVFTDKSGFSAKGYDGKSQSGDDLEQMLLGRGKGGEKSDSYKSFAGNMKDVFDAFEKAVPAKHRGYFKGDMLYFNTPDTIDETLSFKPNIVTYTVQTDSDIGKKIARSKTGVVIHRVVDQNGNEGPLLQTVPFQGTEVLVLPPVTVVDAPNVDMSSIKEVSGIVSNNANDIDNLLNKEKLTAMKVSDFANILYTYTNSKVDTGLDSLGKDFVQWLSGSKVSKNKQAKIIEYIKTNIKAFNALWQTVNGIMRVKDDIITQLENQPADVKASTGGKPGGEGYVLADPQGDIKLVNRAGFSAANRAVKREEINMRASDFTDTDFMRRGVDPADVDDDGSDSPGFKQDMMFNQLGKILDSQSNPTPLDTITTDDGKKLKVNVPQAKTLRMMATSDRVKPAIRLEFTKSIQTSAGLEPFLAVSDPKDMINIFADKYMR